MADEGRGSIEVVYAGAASGPDRIAARPGNADGAAVVLSFPAAGS